MALAHQSISTISSPEFINLSPLDINPLMSSCEIKVFYLGENRNGSYISKDVAAEMAKTLRGAPIVGYYREEKEDFTDHGHQMIFDDTGIHFNCLTKPYGFVSPNAKVWFKDFDDTDEFGNAVTRTYLMTTGYLWTGQFQEAQVVFKDNGKSHSMELDEKTLEGHWAKNEKKDLEFFIINDAIFSKLCILGDDVEPCFEGSGITSPQVSASFTLDDNFKHTLFEMMQQLTEALKGGNEVANVKENIKDSTVVTTDFSEQDKKDKEKVLENELNQDSSKNDASASFANKEDEKKADEKENKEEGSSGTENDDKKENDEDKKKYSLLEEQYNELKDKYALLEQECNELKEFKQKVENDQKDALIAEFSMLSDEDKKDVIENKASYSLDEIKSKLAVMCFEKKVNFNLNDTVENEEDKNEKVVTTFNMNIQSDLSVPDWVKEVENTMNNI